jgi:hypothetical protein
MKYETNKIIDISTQNRQASWYFKYVNDIITLLLAPEDTFSMSSSKKILNVNTFMYKCLTSYMSESNAIRMVNLTMNLAVVAYQYVFVTTKTWFSYFTTTLSGLSKIYKCIFTNPLYGLLFYGTFYLQLLEGTSDEVQFNRISKALGLSSHADLGVTKTFTKIIDYVPEWITGNEIIGFKIVTKELLAQIASAIIVIPTQIIIEEILITSLKKININISKISNPAVYIKSRDRFDFDDTDIQEQLNFLKKQHTNIKKNIKKNINPKNKKTKKQVFMEIAQVKAPAGHVICLNKCKQRVKTQMGCYCEGDCGTTTFLGGKKWCWVDPDKCKNGKYLDKIKNGYLDKYQAYDFCDNKKLSKNNKCFTGLNYTDCEIR